MSSKNMPVAMSAIRDILKFPGAAQIAGIGSCRREEDTSRFLIPGFLDLSNPPQGFTQEFFRDPRFKSPE
jgi:hypothetical protein